jgi:hypothetical protein
MRSSLKARKITKTKIREKIEGKRDFSFSQIRLR